MISVTCPNCQHVLSVPEEYAGQAGTCKKCNARFVVPAVDSAPPAGSPGAGGLALPDDLASALDASLSRPRPAPVVVPNTLGGKLAPLLKPLGLALVLIAVAGGIISGVGYLPALNFGGPSPEEVADAFIQAQNTGDVQQLRPHMTEKAWQNISGMAQGTIQRVESYTVGTAATTGDTAQVPVQATQFGVTVTQDLLLRKEAGGWRVYGMHLEPMPGMGMTMDFENPEAMLGEVKKMMEGMEGMSPEMMKGIEDAMRQQMAN